MKPDERFLKQRKVFWANVRTISEAVGYTEKKRKSKASDTSEEQPSRIKIPAILEVKSVFLKLGLESIYLITEEDQLTEFGKQIFSYFEHRADVLNNFVEPHLMDKKRAKEEFEKLKSELHPKCPLPQIKQKGEKKAYAYFTGIINMLIEANLEGLPCNYDPQQLTAITRNYAPLRTLARRVDGAFPAIIDPTAVWEIKEYYNTTSFGSRVADGIYETLLDGIELEELREEEKIDVKHYLMIDAHDTWWGLLYQDQEKKRKQQQGKSYLCRIIDMLHMGYMDEVLFGYEVLEVLPTLVKEWLEIEKNRTDRLPPLTPETFTPTEKTTKSTRKIIREKTTLSYELLQDHLF